jgi:P4 family phage/plasmid primase-like protien
LAVLNSSNLFELAKTLSLKDTIERYGIKKRGKLYFCPFHNNSETPAMGIRKGDSGDEFFHCFGCGAGGDIIKFVERMDSLEPLRACKKLLNDNGFATEELSEEEQKAIEEAYKKRCELIEQQRAEEAKKRQDEKAKAKEGMRKTAPTYSENLLIHYDKALGQIEKCFVRWESLGDLQDMYLGWCDENDSIVVINKTINPFEVYNIKHRTKKGDYWKSSKWIGVKNSSSFIFPYEHFKDSDDDVVVLCEGEKDAINLCSYGINAVTLGAATAKWEKYAKELEGKTVYIWFDNDKAGYQGAVDRYSEIDGFAKDVYIVLFYHIKSGLPEKYDISDWLFDTKPTDKDEIFKRIGFASFRLTNRIVEEIEQYYPLQIEKKLYKILSFDEVATKLYDKAQKVRGELDDEEIDTAIETIEKNKKKIKEIFEQFCKKEMKEEINKIPITEENYEDREREIIQATTQKYEILEAAMYKTVGVRQTLVNQNRQTHIYDIVQNYIELAKNTGYNFAKYKNQLFIWTGGYYYKIDRENDELEDLILQELFKKTRVDKKKRLAENRDKVILNILAHSTNLNKVKSSQPFTAISFLNGTVRIYKNGKVIFTEEFNKNIACTNFLDYEYNPNADCPKWHRFLDRVMPDLKEQMSLMEFIGYCFYPSHRFEKFLFLYGKTGQNGKSIILTVIRRLLGDANVSDLQLQDFYGHKTVALFNKTANIGSEIDPRGLNDGQMSALKTLTSNEESFQLDPKGKDPITMDTKEKPKLLFSGNEKPQGGMDNGVFRRMLLLTFQSEIKDDEKIRDMADRFYDEMGGIFTMAMEALGRLIANNKFTQSDKMIEDLETYRRDVNPIKQYIDDNIIYDTNCCVPKEWLYRHYKTWCDNNGYSIYTINTFFRKFNDERKTETIRTSIEHETLGDRPRAVVGVYVNSDIIKKIRIGAEVINTDFISRFAKQPAVTYKVDSNTDE